MTAPLSQAAGRWHAAPDSPAQSEAACEVVRELWTLLLAQLRHVADECADPKALRRLRSIGVRRTDVLLAGLASEFVKSSQLAAKSCCAPLALDVLVRAQQLLPGDDLHSDFERLSALYQRLLEVLEPPEGSHRHTWLESRARVHSARAQALR
ncbi:hypothetical protein CDN99_05815 [Roseateles aquatilis]|uniref:Uncharacterized protein n=1 Tax=Roseateles aquatilis TaxID=431061 RepID=A0A246JGV4_9BURK|nr:hypothetical protein [Roseateles aquatilis]OWQ91886.1 hypothetical protein CDN99_05815 [Roseateles aquatilis]